MLYRKKGKRRKRRKRMGKKRKRNRKRKTRKRNKEKRKNWNITVRGSTAPLNRTTKTRISELGGVGKR